MTLRNFIAQRLYHTAGNTKFQDEDCAWPWNIWNGKLYSRGSHCGLGRHVRAM